MTEQAAVLIKFQTCDLARELAAATAAYDSEEATAWVVPFTKAQQAYWATQPVDVDMYIGHLYINSYSIDFSTAYLGNGYADALITARLAAINNAASAAYDVCMAGGVTTPAIPSTEPSFRLTVQTQLAGDNASSDTPSNQGLSTQLQVTFSADGALPGAPTVPWQPFHRVGPITRTASHPSSWSMSIPDSNPSATIGFIKNSTVSISIPWLHIIAANFVQYLPYPAGMAADMPDDMSVPFTLRKKIVSIQIYRQVRTPDGVFSEDVLTWNLYDLNYSGISGNGFTAFVYDGDDSGTVDIRYSIIGYSAETYYRIEDGVEVIFTPLTAFEYGPTDDYVPRWLSHAVNSAGNSLVFTGDFNTGFNYVHESFEYVCLKNKLGLVRIALYGDNGAFLSWQAFLVWLGTPEDVSGIARYWMPAQVVSGTSPPSGASINVRFTGNERTYNVSEIFYDFDLPVIEDVRAKHNSYASSGDIGYNIISGGPTSHIYTEPTTPGHVRLVIHNTLRASYSNFLTVAGDMYL